MYVIRYFKDVFDSLLSFYSDLKVFEYVAVESPTGFTIYISELIKKCQSKS